MKHYKNIFISLISLILALVLYLFFNILASDYSIVFFILLIIGILFAHISSKLKESKHIGNLLLIIEILAMLFFAYILALSSVTP